MTWDFQDRIWTRRMNRRDFFALAGAGLAGAGVGLGGCASDPVTGKSTLVLMSESQEIGIDRDQSRHQFSRDYGASQDAPLNAYIAEVGRDLARVSHRPGMPYSFRAVNAPYVNAYAFPGGSIATTRGILLCLEDESELSALLGHEIGHVAARHAAERQSKGMLTQLAVAGATVAVGSSEYRDFAGLTQTLGELGGTALLAHYSREDEREADALGMRYAARAGANPAGMVGLMDVLLQENKRRPGAIERMFATHPMSNERYATARQRLDADYTPLKDRPTNRERYMDETARLRRIGPAIEAQQAAEQAFGRGKVQQAEAELARALKVAPDDYAGLVMMARAKLGSGDPAAARRYAERARTRYPSEAQAHNLLGIAEINLRQFDAAYQSLGDYDRLLPGNPNTLFLRGVALEGMNRKRDAAGAYYGYLQRVQSGANAKYAYRRLADWGLIRRR
jgi:predicted Zn-dependent protease